MKSYRKELWFQVKGRRAFINITPDVEQCLRESGIQEGMVLVNAMHITASVFINDDESGLNGSKNWRRMRRFHNTATIERAKTMPTRT